MKDLVLPKSIAGLVKASADKWPTRPYVFWRSGSGYVSKTFSDLASDTQAIACALLERGFGGKQVMIFADNCYEWLACDLAVMAYVGVCVGAGKDWLDYDMAMALEATDVALLIYAESKLPTVKKIRSGFPNIKYLCLEDFPKLVAEGRALLASRHARLSGRAQPGSAVCKIVFTSGSTSAPKAVTLTAKNMFACGPGLYQRAPTGPHDIYYLFLPLHHVYAGIDVFLYSYFVGARLYLSSDVHQIASELRTIRPTVLCGVPIIYERIYQSIGPGDMARLQQGLRLSNLLLGLGIDLRRVLFRRFNAALGGRLRYMFSGGAPLDTKVKTFFKQVGNRILEGYGMTETASLISLEYRDSGATSSVGKTFENLRVRIAAPDASGHGEIIVKGDNVTPGYYNNPAANHEAFDAAGYFHTGDIGFLDDHHNLYVLGRKAHIIVRKNGEKFAADELIRLLKGRSHHILKAKVFEQGHTLTAVLMVGLKTKLPAARIIRDVNQQLPPYKQIEHFVVQRVDARTLMK